jgi:hypothetical protein
VCSQDDRIDVIGGGAVLMITKEGKEGRKKKKKK